MQFNLTAKDKHALMMLAADLRNMLQKKKGEGPEYEPVIDLSFFRNEEGKGLDDILNWVQDFMKRVRDTEKNQSKEELESETKELLNARWLTENKP